MAGGLVQAVVTFLTGGKDGTVVQVSSTNPLPVTMTGGGGGGDASAANQTILNTRTGDLTETAPASDTASSGLNGRLQRIAQNITTLIGRLPASLGVKANSASFSVAPSSDGTWPLGPSTASGAAITPVVGAANVHSLVVKASAGNHYGGTAIAGTTAGFLIALNLAAAPATGAAITPVSFVSIAAGATGSIGEFTVPDRHSTGVVYVFSTSLTTYTQAATAPALMRGRAV